MKKILFFLAVMPLSFCFSQSADTVDMDDFLNSLNPTVETPAEKSSLEKTAETTEDASSSSETVSAAEDLSSGSEEPSYDTGAFPASESSSSVTGSFAASNASSEAAADESGSAVSEHFYSPEENSAVTDVSVSALRDETAEDVSQAAEEQPESEEIDYLNMEIVIPEKKRPKKPDAEKIKEAERKDEDGEEYAKNQKTIKFGTASEISGVIDKINEAEDLKRNNPRAYLNEYEGKVTGTGGNVFENVEIRDITDEELENFDKAKQGLDWGYFPDPTAFVRLQYDPSRMIIYVFDEVKRLKTGNEELIDILKEYKNTQTIADNAEEKSIAFFRSNGYNIRACVKGPGSVDFGVKWLASRSKIVIDRRRCPETATEFEKYEYLKDKDGNFISGYPDKDNHFIDAVRYALNDEIMRSKAAVKKVRY